MTESQIVGILGEGEADLLVAEICRKHGVYKATYHKWKSKKLERSYANLKISKNDSYSTHSQRYVKNHSSKLRIRIKSTIM